MAVMLGTACGQGSELFVAWPAIDAELAYLFETNLDSSSSFARSNSFAMKDGARTDGMPQRIQLAEDRASVLISFLEAEIEDRGIVLRSPIATEATVLDEPTDCPDGKKRSEALDQWTQFSWARVGAQAHRVTVGDPTFRPRDLSTLPFTQALSIELATDPEPCPASEQRWLRRFDPDQDVWLAPGQVILGAPRDSAEMMEAMDFFYPYDLVRLDENRLLVIAGRVVYQFTKGRAFTDEPSQRSDAWSVLPPFSDPADAWALRSLALDPMQSRPERSVLYATASSSYDPSDPRPDRGAVLELIVDPSGIQSVRTATVVPFRLSDVHIDSGGAMFILGFQELVNGVLKTEAHLLRRSAVGDPFEVWGLGDIEAVETQESPDPNVPHLVGFDDGLVGFGDLRATPPRLDLENVFATSKISSLTSHLGPEGLEVWVSNNRGEVARRDPDGTWSTVRLSVPLRARSCGTNPDECGDFSPVDRFLGMHLTGSGDHIVARALRCDALFTLRRSDACMGSILLPDAVMADRVQELRAGDVRAGVMTVAGRGMFIGEYDVD